MLISLAVPVMVRVPPELRVDPASPDDTLTVMPAEETAPAPLTVKCVELNDATPVTLVVAITGL